MYNISGLYATNTEFLGFTLFLMGLSLYKLSQENHDYFKFCTDSVQFINMTTTCNILQATKN